MTIEVSYRWFRKHLLGEVKRYGVVGMEAQKEFLRIMEEIPRDVCLKILQEEADRLSRLVVAEIEAQPFWWKPLNEAYRIGKIKAGLDDRMLIATKEYIESIGVQEVQRGKHSFSIRVGVPNRIHQASGLNFNKLARIHEFGTGTGPGTIPARPHWAPVFRRWKKYVPKVVERVYGRVPDRLQRRLKRIITSPTRAKTVKPAQ